MSTKSLGQQDVYVSQRQVGTVRVLALHAYGALSPRLYLRLGWTVREFEADSQSLLPIKGYRLRALQGELRLSEYADAVASLQWIDPQQAAVSSSHPHEWHVQLTTELDRRKVELIDRHRKGGHLTLYLQLWPTFVGEANSWYDSEVSPLRFEVVRDDWLSILEGLGVGRYLVLEVPLTTVNAEAFTQAAKSVQHALKHLDEGNYNDAISACRLADDAMRHVLGVRGNESFAEYLMPHVGERRAKEYSAALGALRKLMQMTHHISSDSPVFSRGEAVFVVQSLQHALALVGGLVADA